MVVDHSDLENEAQTVTVSNPPFRTPPATGDDSLMMFYLGMFIVATGGLLVMLIDKSTNRPAV